jgi:hypothetical protein
MERIVGVRFTKASRHAYKNAAAETSAKVISSPRVEDCGLNLDLWWLVALVPSAFEVLLKSTALAVKSSAHLRLCAMRRSKLMLT